MLYFFQDVLFYGNERWDNFCSVFICQTQNLWLFLYYRVTCKQTKRVSGGEARQRLMAGWGACGTLKHRKQPGLV